MQFLSWYWQTFGVDFSNPMFWVSAIALQAFLLPIGAVVGYRWGLLSPQAHAYVLACAAGGLYLNLAF